MRTLILGFDSFDPIFFERLASQGKLPNLSRYAGENKYAHFEVSNPPQTEVSWTSIATGLNPGGHGIFDFVHRDPATYTPYVSLLPTQRNALGVQFVPPHQARTIFEEAAQMGYPATSLWWPATFPARPELPVSTIPGLGTPDILGKLGVGTLFTTATRDSAIQKTQVIPLAAAGKEQFTASLPGPMTKKGSQVQAATVDLRLELSNDQTARLIVGKQAIPLRVGKWSEIFEAPFKMGLFYTVRSVTRAILTETHPEVKLYFLPLQIHPLASPWRYATPPSFIKDVWKANGPFLTLGWPQDTSGLEDRCIDNDQFLALCDAICQEREKLLMRQIDSFREGILAAIFDSLDRVQHMFWRERPDIVEQWYIKLDGLVGRVEQRLKTPGKSPAKLLVLSDHGFSDFRYKVHLNRWLGENNALSATTQNGAGDFGDVDWSKSLAYAIGLNSLYFNLANREGQGWLTPDQTGPLSEKLRQQILDLRGPDGRQVVQRVVLKEEAFSGPMTEYGPDMLIGYAPGYRASSETGLGKWSSSVIEANPDHWEADHCIDSQAVPGVIFCNQGLQNLAHPSYRDIPWLTIGKQLDQNYSQPPKPPATSSGEDKEIIEERLKSLGYL